MNKLKMRSTNLIQENVKKLCELFPSCVTEVRDEVTGGLHLAVDFDQLRQELGDRIVEGPRERYRLDWQGKQGALLASNSAIAKTLRPAADESVDFDKTQNLFIESDNLEALKLLRKTYLGQIKLIYIDPPYNTGGDFVYNDDFAENSKSFLLKSLQVNTAGEKLVANPDSNGRFHSAWLTMMYSRLRVARALLPDDGAIFISIDESEKANLRKICDEVFGSKNFRNAILTRRRVKSLNSQFADDGLYSLNVGYEYVLIYAKNRNFLMNALRMKKKNASKKGKWNVFWSGADRPTMRYELLGFTPKSGQWRWSQEKATSAIENYNQYLDKHSENMTLEEYWRKTGEKLKFVRRIKNGIGKNGGVQYWIAPSDTALRTSNWTDIEVSQIKKDFELPFENPKSVELMMELIRLIGSNDFTVLDFFAGSSTTADAIMRLNAEDGGKRKFIMIQIPEPTAESSVARKAGFTDLAQISKERLHQAGERVLKNDCHPGWNRDIGFRVLKVDTSNMKDVFYRPDAIHQKSLLDMVDNVKEDRTAEDLLFQVLVDWGVDLTLPIQRETVQGKTVFFVDNKALVACFDMGITEDMVKNLARHKPLRVVFRDNGFVSDAVKINVEQIFRQISPTTEVKSI